jgi:hypothetical protein
MTENENSLIKQANAISRAIYGASFAEASSEEVTTRGAQLLLNSVQKWGNPELADLAGDAAEEILTLEKHIDDWSLRLRKPESQFLTSPPQPHRLDVHWGVANNLLVSH